MATIDQRWWTRWGGAVIFARSRPPLFCHKFPNLSFVCFSKIIRTTINKSPGCLSPKCLHRHCLFFSCTCHGLFNTLLFCAWKPKARCSPPNLTHWNGSAVDLVCVSSKVPQRPYGSLEVYKERRQERLPTVQCFNSLRRERPTLREMCRITLWSSA